MTLELANNSTSPVLHIRYGGESVDISCEAADIGDLSTDEQIKQAAADFLEAPLSKFSNFVVSRNADTGDVTLRPQAVFG